MNLRSNHDTLRLALAAFVAAAFVAPPSLAQLRHLERSTQSTPAFEQARGAGHARMSARIAERADKGGADLVDVIVQFDRAKFRKSAPDAARLCR